jgi:hypothetical protein
MAGEMVQSTGMKRNLLSVMIWGIVLMVCAEPPFHGTIFIDRDILTESDPSSFRKLVGSGTGQRRMFDRRVNNWIETSAHLFRAEFEEPGMDIEVQVNSEFSADQAQVEANRYLRAIGQLPVCLRKDVETVWIHDGLKPFGGGNNNLLIHTGQGAEYIAKGILEETFIHEATHTSIDAYHWKQTEWLAAQKNDPEFISTYARDNPRREDLAESFLLYLAVRHRPDRIDSDLKNLVEKTIPHRIAYFDSLVLNLEPFAKGKTGTQISQ